MKLEVISEHDNRVIGRKEYEVFVDEVEGATPSRKEVLKKMAAELDFDPDHAVLESFNTTAGISSLHFYLKVYDNQASILESAQRKLGLEIMAQPETEAEEEEEEKEKEEEESEEEEQEETVTEQEAQQEPEEVEEKEAEEKEGAEDGEEVEEKEEEEESEEIDYDQIVDNTIKDAQAEIKELADPDWQALLEAEEKNKDRKTMIGWLEEQSEN